MKSGIDVDAKIKRAGHYFVTGNFKKAAALYQEIHAQQPDNLRVQASMTQVDAELGRISFDDALIRMKDLVAAHPEDDRLPGSLISVLARMGRKNESLVERRIYLDRFPESPRALQMWANGLQVNPETKDQPDAQARAWAFYQQALQSGPLITPCFKSAAYRAARRADRTHASEALDGSKLLERLAIRTRELGPRVMMFILLLGVVFAIVTLPKELGVSIVVQLLTFTWGSWCVYSNNLMCCKKCRNVWIIFVGYLTAIAAIADHPKTWYVVAAVAAALVMWARLTGNTELIWPDTKEAQKQDAAH